MGFEWTLGFADLTILSSGTSATLSVDAVPGAASTALGEVLQIHNQDSTRSWSVTLSRSAAPDADFSSFVFSIAEQGGPSVDSSWNLVTESSTGPFTMSPGEIWELSLTLALANGVTGAQGSFDLQVSIAPV